MLKSNYAIEQNTPVLSNKSYLIGLKQKQRDIYKEKKTGYYVTIKAKSQCKGKNKEGKERKTFSY